MMDRTDEDIKMPSAKETCELSPVQMEGTRLTTRPAVLNTRPAVPTSRPAVPHDLKITNGREGDMRSINQVYLLNQKELSYKSTCSRNSTHQGITERKKWFKILSYEEVIQCSSQRIGHEPEGDQRLLNGELQSNQEEPSCKPTCFGNLFQHKHAANWIHTKRSYGLEVIQFLNQEISSLLYLEAHKFNHLPNRLWRPGEVDKHSGDSYNHPGESFIILSCTSIQRIRRILSYSLLPYFNMFTLGATTHQRLVCLCCCFLDNFYDDQNVPKKLTYPLRPTRYKGATPSTNLCIIYSLCCNS